MKPFVCGFPFRAESVSAERLNRRAASFAGPSPARGRRLFLDVLDARDRHHAQRDGDTPCRCLPPIPSVSMRVAATYMLARHEDARHCPDLANSARDFFVVFPSLIAIASAALEKCSLIRVLFCAGIPFPLISFSTFFVPLQL